MLTPIWFLAPASIITGAGQARHPAESKGPYSSSAVGMLRLHKTAANADGLVPLSKTKPQSAHGNKPLKIT